MTNFDLTVLRGASTGDKFSFELPEAGVIIGRSSEADLVLQDQLVSRKHVKIFSKDGQILIADLGSTHGTVHMGFRLEPGEENARRLSSDDEFKMGDSLFRINFDEVIPVKEVVASPAKKPFKIPKKKLPLIALMLVALGAVLFLLLGDDDSAPPQQRTGEKITLPEKSTLGFVSEGDKSHADKVQIELPPSDGILEFDYLGSGSTSVNLDGVKIDTLPKSEGGWEQRVLLFRDLIGGKERLLVFDEEKNGADTVALLKPVTRWGVRNLRFSPIPYSQDRSADDALNGSLALADFLGRNSNSLYQFTKSLQKAGLLLLRESGFDAQAVNIDRQSARPDQELVKLQLEGLIQERKEGVTPESVLRHAKVVNELIGICESELWRKFTVDIRQALTDSKSKYYIDAHDRLLAVQTMIGDESDYRYKKAGELLDDKKVIPARVRKSPGRYRKD